MIIMKKFLFVCLTFLFLSISAQYSYQYGHDSTRLNLKNGVYKVTETAEFTGRENYKRISKFTFNKKGNLTDIEYLNSKDDDKPKHMSFKKIAYDRFDRPISMEELKARTTFKYAHDTVIIQKDADSFIEKSTYTKLKNKEYLVSELSIDNEKEITKGEFIYDSKYRIIESTEIIFSKGKTDTVKIKSEYYENCHYPKQQTIHNLTTSNILNNKCDIVESTAHFSNGNTHKSVFTYKYDKKDNWIERTELVNGKVSSFSTRIIEYY